MEAGGYDVVVSRQGNNAVAGGEEPPGSRGESEGRERPPDLTER